VFITISCGRFVSLNTLPEAMELGNRSKAEAVASAVEEAGHDGYTRDDMDLMRLGKKPALKRNFGFMQILGFVSFECMG
jgi:hypothetical protein